MSKAKPKVLIIDDDPLMLTLYSHKFVEEHFEVFTALSGEEGIEIARKEKPDIALIDIVMPDPDGMATLAKMKADPEINDIPAIMLTNLKGLEYEEESRQLGATAYVVKSDTTLRDLVALVRKYLPS